jgi:hypothetical protein
MSKRMPDGILFFYPITNLTLLNLFATPSVLPGHIFLQTD